MKEGSVRTVAISLTLALWAAPSWALTVSWDCNPEPDVTAYRVEYSRDAGVSWGVEGMVPHPTPCVSPVTLDSRRYLAPGQKLIRVFALDADGNHSLPSQSVPYVVLPQPVGNTGGRVEDPLPPSPYVPVVVLPPPPPDRRLKDALTDGLQTCLTRKLAHTACMKALAEALGKVSP